MNRAPLAQDEMTAVRQVRDALASKFSECYDAPGDPCGQCEQCVIAAAVDRLDEIVEPPDLPVERYRDRLAYNGGVNGEAYFLHEWQVENRREMKFGRGKSILQHVLDRRPTIAEAEAVASFVSWMGTNVGRGFFMKLVTAEKRLIADADEKRKREHAEEMERVADQRRQREAADAARDGLTPEQEQEVFRQHRAHGETLDELKTRRPELFTPRKP
jgi:hypothetical protein